MKGIIADINIAGQVRRLVETFYQSAEWTQIWSALDLQRPTFTEFG